MLCITILLVLVSCAAAKPVILLSYGGEESDHKYLDCFNPEAEFDPSTGYITYRCRPVVKEVIEEIFVDKKPLFDVKNLNFLNEIDGNPLKEIFEDTLIVEESSDEDDEEQIIYEVVDIEAWNPISQKDTLKNQGTSYVYQDQSKKTKSECKYNCCPEGQMFQSELDICIDYQSETPLPAVSSNEQISIEVIEASPDNKSSTIYITDSQEEKPQADSPQTKPQKNNPQSLGLPASASSTGGLVLLANGTSIESGTVLAVGKFDLKNRCQDNEFYLSELDICVPLDK